MVFVDRVDAGRRLARRLAHLSGAHLVVLGLPRGGVPVAAQIALALHAPLDVIVVRKLGVPYQPELGMGAIGEGGVRVISEPVVRAAGVSREQLVAVERAELERRLRVFRAVRRQVPLVGRVALVVDDGIATGSTARAACQVARASGASRVVLAAPVAPAEEISALEEVADEVVTLLTPTRFFAIGEFYDDFRQSSDEEVCHLLQTAQPDEDSSAPPVDPDGQRTDEVQVPVGELLLPGLLTVPARPRGLVIFAHGSGSSRHSPRNQQVAAGLVRAGFATLLLDLLSTREEADPAHVFDIVLLGGRLAEALRWVRGLPGMAALPVGLFGASTGAGAALWVAAELPDAVAALVSRGGRPDLAGPWLAEVRAPTLLVVGGRDEVVLRLNREAAQRLGGPSRLEVVPGSTHLFEEPGALVAVTQLARDWFAEHLVAPGAA